MTGQPQLTQLGGAASKMRDATGGEAVSGRGLHEAARWKVCPVLHPGDDVPLHARAAHLLYNGCQRSTAGQAAPPRRENNEVSTAVMCKRFA